MDERVTPLRLAMRRRGHTNASLAAALGCSRSQITHVLAGRPLLDPYRAKALALGFTPDELCTDATVPEVVEATRQLLGEAARSSVAEARAAQGLPEHVTDEQVLDAVARMIAKVLLDPQPERKAQR